MFISREFNCKNTLKHLHLYIFLKTNQEAISKIFFDIASYHNVYLTQNLYLNNYYVMQNGYNYSYK